MTRIIDHQSVVPGKLCTPYSIALSIAQKEFEEKYQHRRGNHFVDDISKGLDIANSKMSWNKRTVSTDSFLDLKWDSDDVGFKLLMNEVYFDYSVLVPRKTRWDRISNMQDQAYYVSQTQAPPRKVLERIRKLDTNPNFFSVNRAPSASDEFSETQIRQVRDPKSFHGLGFKPAVKKSETTVELLTHHILMNRWEEVLDKFVFEYRSFFMTRGGYLTRKGQHMSLPLSWPLLSCITTSAVYNLMKDPSHLLWYVGRLHSEIEHGVFETDIEVDYVPSRFKNFFKKNCLNGKYILNGALPHNQSDPANVFIREKIVSHEREDGEPNFVKPCHRCQIDALSKRLEGRDPYEKAQHLVEKMIGVVSVTLGDDGVHACQLMSQLLQIRSFIERFGGVIHKVKDVVSHEDRYVLGEYLVDKDEFVELIRPSMILPSHIHPKFQWRMIRSMENSPIYFFLPEKSKKHVDHLIERLFSSDITKMNKAGIPTYVPREFGGFGVSGLMPKWHVDCFYECLSLSAEDFSHRIDEMIQSVNKRPNNLAWKAITRQILQGVSFGGVGLSRKEYNKYVMSLIEKYQFSSDGLEMPESEIIVQRTHSVWVPSRSVETPNEFYLSIQMQNYLLDLIRAKRDSLAYDVLKS